MQSYAYYIENYPLDPPVLGFVTYDFILSTGCGSDPSSCSMKLLPFLLACTPCRTGGAAPTCRRLATCTPRSARSHSLPACCLPVASASRPPPQAGPYLRHLVFLGHDRLAGAAGSRPALSPASPRHLVPAQLLAVPAASLTLFWPASVEPPLPFRLLPPSQAASIAACTSTTQLPQLRLAERVRYLGSAAAVAANEQAADLPCAELADLAAMLRGKQYDVRLDGSGALYARKGLLGRMAPIGVHAGLLLTIVRRRPRPLAVPAAKPACCCLIAALAP